MFLFFFFNDTATTEIYTLSLHDALPIFVVVCAVGSYAVHNSMIDIWYMVIRSEEHTSELQSRSDLVCRLLLEKKKLERIRELGSRPEAGRARRRLGLLCALVGCEPHRGR